MLKILKRIVQDVTTANQLTDALQTLVERVRKAVTADAVSVFLIDNRKIQVAHHRIFDQEIESY